MSKPIFGHTRAVVKALLAMMSRDNHDANWNKQVDRQTDRTMH